MAEVISVRFKEVGKNYYFDPKGAKYNKGDKVIVETARGLECGEVTIGNRDLPEEEITAPLKPVLRMANETDLKTVTENKEKEKAAFDVCLEKIKSHKLDMKLVDVEYTFDRNKILFYFTADGRVDFRELVKDLAAVFRTRIELRQIGVEMKAKRWAVWASAADPSAVTPSSVIFSPFQSKWQRNRVFLFLRSK